MVWCRMASYERTVDAKDRRNTLITLTRRGEGLLEPILHNTFKDMEIAFDNFSEEEILQFLELLAKFRGNTARLAAEIKPVEVA